MRPLLYSAGSPVSHSVGWGAPSPEDGPQPREAFAPAGVDPLIAALAALGPVLCLYPAAEAHPLAALDRACRCVCEVGVDSDGPSEALRFLDHRARCCWQLCLLPDSDYLQWDRLCGQLPSTEARSSFERSARLCCASIVRAAGQTLWRACPLRLHAVAGSHGLQLAAAVTDLSPTGRRCAERLMRRARAVAGTGLDQASASSR